MYVIQPGGNISASASSLRKSSSLSPGGAEDSTGSRNVVFLLALLVRGPCSSVAAAVPLVFLGVLAGGGTDAEDGGGTDEEEEVEDAT